MVKKTDEELIEMFQTGDSQAFEQLFTRYKGPIFTFLVRQCGNRDVASDLTQDVFTKIIKKSQSFAHQSKFSTWIYAIARNAAVDHARKAKHRRHASLDQSAREGPTLMERIAGDNPSPERGTAARDLREALAAAIEKLPEDQREVFILREYHGMPFHEIAEVVGSKVGTVKSRMRYALESLRRDLRKYEEYARELT